MENWQQWRDNTADSLKRSEDHEVRNGRLEDMKRVRPLEYKLSRQAKIDKKNEAESKKSGGTKTTYSLSPEQVEAIFDKAVDINKYGTAHSIIKLERLGNILKDGLLGFVRKEDVLRKQYFNPNSREEYVRELKESRISNNSPKVYFNIVGRQEYFGDQTSENQKIADLNYFKETDTLDIVFDVSGFKETDIPEVGGGTYGKIHQREFTLNEHSVKKNARGDRMAPPELGFMLSTRVPPRLIEGIIFYKTKIIDSEHLPGNPDLIGGSIFGPCGYTYEGKRFDYVDGIGWATEEDDDSMLDVRVEQIAQIMIKSGGVQVPIYDVHGNMWWPKKMSYEEIKIRSNEKAT